MSPDSLAEIKRLNFMLAAVTKVSTVLVRAKSEEELYDSVCQVLTHQDMFLLAWVGLPSSDLDKTIKVLSKAGTALPYLDGIKVNWNDSPNGNGPSGRAVKTGEVQFNNNMLTNQQFRPWADKARIWNLQSSFCLPIKAAGGQVMSVLMVYSAIPEAFGPQELQLLNRLGEDLSFGVEAFRIRAAYAEEIERRLRAEQGARLRLEELSRIGRIAVAQSLSTSIAHELNQPLGAIISNVQAAELALASGFAYAPVLREIIADISGEARRAGQIISNLRSMIEQRNSTLELIDLNALILATCELAKWGTSDSRISIDLDLRHGLPLVLGNRVQLQQVILNLVTNAKEALKELDRGGVVGIVTHVDETGAACLSVRDDGPGVPTEKIEKIFDPFYTTKVGGTGMGLWISYMLVEQHGGKLEVRNIVSGGACFNFSLPSAKRP